MLFNEVEYNQPYKYGPDSMQQYYDETVERLRNSGKSYEGYACVYSKTETTPGCAIGHKVEDPKLARALDSACDLGLVINNSISAIANSFPGLVGYLWPDSKAGIQLALELQRTHDSPVSWSEGKFNKNGENNLEAIATRFNLNYSSPVAS